MKKSKFFTALLILFLGCQEAELTTDNLEDPDMEAALVEVEEYFSKSRRSKSDVDVTVIKYKKEELLYKTNTVKGRYSPIYEETVTAVTVIDGFIFWKKAGGVKRLIEIELDDHSEELLGDSEPFEIKEGKLWALRIPDERDLRGKTLKYDIIYQLTSGEVIRLDPKIQIKQHK